jgi:uncharacterized membrane protein YccC
MVLRRGLVAAAVTPSLFAIGLELLDNSVFAIFATFASFSCIGLVWFGGPMRTRAVGYAGFAATAAGLVVLGTLCSRTVAAAVIVMVVVGFSIRYVAVFGGYLAAGASALPLAFVLPVMLPAEPDALGPRLAGWLTGCVVASVAILVVVPDRQREELRTRAASLCRDLALLVLGSPSDGALDDQLDDVVERQRQLREVWAAMPQHPAGPGLADQAYLSILEQLTRAAGFVKRDVHLAPDPETDSLALPLRHAVADTLHASAELLERRPADPALEQLSRARSDSRDLVKRWVDGHGTGTNGSGGATAQMVVERVERGYPLLVISHLAVSIGANASLMAGRPLEAASSDLAPDVPNGGAGVAETAARAVKLLVAHFHLGDLSFRQGVRSALVLAAAVYVATTLPFGHKFWVVLGALSVLRTNAVGTGATGLQAVLGTAAGMVLSGVALQIGATDSIWLWPAVVITVFFCVYAPTAIGFIVGQASFTLFVVFLFTLIEPAGWDTGVSRLIAVSSGVLVAVLGGLVLWPRGAQAVVGRRVAAFYRASSRYLDTAGHSFLASDGSPDVDADAGLHRVMDQTIETRWLADDSFSGLVGEQRTSPEVLEAWVRLIGVPSSVRQVASVVGTLAPRGYPTCSCTNAAEAVELELDRVEASLERVASRLEHPEDNTAIAWDGDLAHARQVLVGCVTEQLERPPAERESAIGLLWVLESLHYLDSVMSRMGDPLDDVCASLSARAFR